MSLMLDIVHCFFQLKNLQWCGRFELARPLGDPSTDNQGERGSGETMAWSQKYYTNNSSYKLKILFTRTIFVALSNATSVASVH